MKKPADLRMNPDRLYAFKSPFKILLVRMIDAVGKFFYPSSVSRVPWENVKRIAVLRLDHLGDVLLALPSVKALEEALPNAQVDFIVGPWAKDIVELAGLRSITKVFTAAWFDREGVRRRTWPSWRELKKILRDGRYDAVIELRGDFRHILAMYRAGIKYRIALARTGLAFLLTHQSVYHAGQHEVKRNLDTLEQAGIQLANKPESPRLYPRNEDVKTQAEIRQKLGIARPIIAIHATCTAPSKRWLVSSWQELIDKLPEDTDVVMIGAGSEKAGIEEIEKGCRRKVFLAAGSMNLAVLAAFLKESSLFIGVDSGPAHIAASVGTPVVSLYSGTNVAAQWGPQGSKVNVIQKVPPCSPCELAICPIGNKCMNEITVEEVLNLVANSLH